MSPREKMRLATAAMGGDQAARAKLGASTIAELYAIMKAAHASMSTTERENDAARTEFELDALASGRPLS